jgi:hypothetical protein
MLYLVVVSIVVGHRETTTTNNGAVITDSALGREEFLHGRQQL